MNSSNLQVDDDLFLPVSVNKFIKIMFMNGIDNSVSKEKIRFIYSLANLTNEQRESITEIMNNSYSNEFRLLNIYILVQIDKYDSNNILINTSHYLISLVKKDNAEFVYGLYYTIKNQPYIRSKILAKSPNYVNLSNNVTIETSDIIEAFYILNNQIISHVLEFKDNNLHAMMKFRNKCRMFNYIIGTELENSEVNSEVNRDELCNLSVNINNFI